MGIRGATMKKSFLVIVLVAAAIVYAGAGGAQDRADGPKPKAEIRESRFDFGEIFERAEYAHEFVIKNVGKADLVIEEVKPG